MRYLWKTIGRGKVEWFIILFNWNICIFSELPRGITERKESIKLYIMASIVV